MLSKCCHEDISPYKNPVSMRVCGALTTIPTLQQRCDSKLFCLEMLSSFAPDYLMYPYYSSLPIYCYHFVISLDNSQNISQSVIIIIISKCTC